MTAELLSAREAWLLDRRTGIGGSDAAAAVGLSKWKTPLELYMDKRGELQTSESEPMKWGNLLEPVIRQEYCNRTGRSVVVPQGIIRHPSVTFAIMTPDGIADESRVLQVKTARSADGWGEPGSSEIPQEYLLQVQHEMFVTQLLVADVAVLVGGSDFRLYEVPADPELQGILIEQESAFWDCVLNETPPAPMSREDVMRRWPTSKATRSTTDKEGADLAQTLANIKAFIKGAEELEGEITARLQMQMQDADELADESGSILATWKSAKGASRFDVHAFKESHPELYEEFLSDPKPQRRFLLKLKGSEACLQQLPKVPKLAAHS